MTSNYSSTPLPLEVTPVTWEVFLQTRTGAQLIPLNGIATRGQVYVSLNGLGSFWLELDRDKLRAAGYEDIPDRMLIEFVRKHGAVRKFSFYKLKTVRTGNRLTISGLGLNVLLQWREIAYYAGSSYAYKTAALDNMAKAIVRENLTSVAVHYQTGAPETGRDYGQVLTFTVEADVSAAPSDTLGFAWENVYETLLKICTNSAEQGTRLFFEVARIGDEAFEFRTYTNLPGIDRRAGRTLGAEAGNLSDTEYVRDATGEITYLYVAGKGEADQRKIEEVTVDRELDALTRVERTYNATTTPNPALAGVGREVLQRYKVLETFDGKLVSNAGGYYGVDWDLGDMLDAHDGPDTFSILVTGLEMLYGAPSVTGSFEVVADA